MSLDGRIGDADFSIFLALEWPLLLYRAYDWKYLICCRKGESTRICLGEEGSLGEKSADPLGNWIPSSFPIWSLAPASCRIKSLGYCKGLTDLVGNAWFEELEAAVAAVFELPWVMPCLPEEDDCCYAFVCDIEPFFSLGLSDGFAIFLKQPLLISYSLNVKEFDPLVWWKKACLYLKILAGVLVEEALCSLSLRTSSFSWLHPSIMNFLFSSDFIAIGRVLLCSSVTV